MLNRSVIGKLWISIVVLILVVLVFLSFGLSRLLENFYYSQISSDLINHGQQLIEMMDMEDDPQQLVYELTLLSSFIDSHIIIVDEQGIVEACDGITGLPSGYLFRPEELQRAFAGEIISKRGYHNHFEGVMLSVAVPVHGIDSDVERIIMIFRPVAPISGAINSMRWLIIYSAVVAIILASIVSFFLSRTLSRPLLQMNHAANEMARGNFDQKVRVKSTDEVGLLGASLNNLSGQLKGKITELYHEKAKLEKVLDSMSDGVITLDANGNTVLVNGQAESLLNLDENAIAINESFFERIKVKGFKELFLEVKENKSVNQKDIELAQKVVSVRMAPLLDHSNNSVVGAVGVLQDVTKERALEQMRRDFIANVSHELRTPLSLIQGYSEAIIDGVANNASEQDKYAIIIHQETVRLMSMVNELLDISRLQTGNFTLAMTSVNLGKLLDTIQEKYKPSVENAGLKFETMVENDLPKIEGDYDRLQQVLINLIENSLKHTSRGKILLKAYTDIKHQICVEVADTGSGIPKEELELIWERFYKADKSRTRGKGATGLGLAIVKSIVEAHGGYVWVNSIEGEGSIFGFCLPNPLIISNSLDKKGP